MGLTNPSQPPLSKTVKHHRSHPISDHPSPPNHQSMLPETTNRLSLRNCAGRSATDQKARDVSTVELLSKEQFQLIYKVAQVSI
ncbi:hypothetical protein ACS0TY_032663 [Phlomoides rotata]